MSNSSTYIQQKCLLVFLLIGLFYNASSFAFDECVDNDILVGLYARALAKLENKDFDKETGLVISSLNQRHREELQRFESDIAESSYDKTDAQILVALLEKSLATADNPVEASDFEREINDPIKEITVHNEGVTSATFFTKLGRFTVAYVCITGVVFLGFTVFTGIFTTLIICLGGDWTCPDGLRLDDENCYYRNGTKAHEATFDKYASDNACLLTGLLSNLGPAGIGGAIVFACICCGTVPFFHKASITKKKSMKALNAIRTQTKMNLLPEIVQSTLAPEDA